MTDHATTAPRSSPGLTSEQAFPTGLDSPPELASLSGLRDARRQPGAAGRGPTPAAGGLSGTRYVLGVVLLVCLAWIPVLIITAAGRMSLHP